MFFVKIMIDWFSAATLASLDSTKALLPGISTIIMGKATLGDQDHVFEPISYPRSLSIFVIVVLY